MLLTTLYATATLLSAYSAYDQYKSASAAADFQANIASQNAHLAKKQKREIEEQSVITAKRIEKQTKEFIQEQLVTYSDSGVDTSSSTVKEVMSSTARTGAADIVDSMNNFAKEAWNKDFESRIERSRAGTLRGQADRFRLLAPYAAATELFTGAASLYYYRDRLNATSTET